MLESGSGREQRRRLLAEGRQRRLFWSAVSLRKARLCEWRLPARSAVLCVCFGSAVSRAVERGWLCGVRCVIHAAVLCGCAVGYPAVCCVSVVIKQAIRVPVWLDCGKGVERFVLFR